MELINLLECSTLHNHFTLEEGYPESRELKVVELMHLGREHSEICVEVEECAFRKKYSKNGLEKLILN